MALLLSFIKRFAKIEKTLEVEQISALESIWNGFDFTYILSILLGLIPALLCITLHELSHGFVAYKLGDNTARDRGRLTLNPLKHLDVMGLLMLLVFHVGWAKPVPVNMYNFKDPKKGMAVTALAGPVSNFLITLVFMFLFGFAYTIVSFHYTKAGYYVLQLLQLTAYISLGLGLFNLIPIPPLDGSKVLLSLLSDSNYYKLLRYERYGMILMILLVSTGIIGKPLSAAMDAIYNFLLPLAQWGADLSYNLFFK